MSALDDVVSIFDLFSADEPALSQADIARRLDRPKSTISRVVRRLQEAGILEFDSNRRLYSPGLRLLELGEISRSRRNFLDLVFEKVERICEVGGHTGYISALDGPDLIVLRTFKGSSPLAIATSPGNKAPTYATSNGRAMLALLEDGEWSRRVPDPLPYVSPNSPGSHAALREIIGRIRSTGRSSSANETLEGVASQGIALRDPETHEILGIAISYPHSMASEELKEKIALLLDEMRAELSKTARLMSR